MREAAEAQAVTVSIAIPEDIELSLERSRIERVFTNLLANGLEAMPGGGTISISAEVARDMVLINVQDDGPGIPGGDPRQPVPALRQRRQKERPRPRVGPGAPDGARP